MRTMSIFVLAVLLLAPISINAAESDETKETMEALSNEVTGTWKAVGPEGRKIYAVAIDPSNASTIYAGTDDGVFKSTDAGGSWSTSGPPNTFIYALAIDHSHPSSIYAVGDGVYSSTDGGASWNTIACGGGGSLSQIGGSCFYVSYSLAINPSNPSIFYEGNNGNIQEWNNGSFTSILTGFAVSALVFDPSNPSIFYAGTNGGVFKSTDGGASWSAFNSGLSNKTVLALAIDPSTTSIIYAGTDGGVFKSTDGGAIWSAINNGPSNTHVTSLAIDPSSPTFIYAGTDGGVFESTDGGASWSVIDSGLSNTHVTSLAIDPSNTGIIYAGTLGGVFKSSPAEGPPSLHVSKSGTGDGRVTSNPSGIDCGSTCTGTYNQGTTVTLTATPSSGSVFAGWSGACSGTGDCIVTMDSDKLVMATFNSQAQYRLTVVKAGTGDGTVTSSPAGISCGSTCIETFQGPTKVKLTAKADSGSTFTGWSGGGSSGTKPCNVDVNSAVTITASFEKKLPHISVSSNSLDFANVKVGKSLKKTLKIVNNGTGDLSVSIGGLTGTDFSVTGSGALTVKPGKSYNLNVTFKPSSPGAKTATLSLNSNDLSTPTVNIALSGTGQ